MDNYRVLMWVFFIAGVFAIAKGWSIGWLFAFLGIFNDFLGWRGQRKEEVRPAKEFLFELNKEFNRNGTVRYDADLERLDKLEDIEIAKIVAELHPFVDGNKRTAIKFMEIRTGKEVPKFVYEILKDI